jgi:hypothetical protein
MYLLDTCVFSEFAKPVADSKVVHWAWRTSESDQYLSVLVLGELLRGMERLPAGSRRTLLQHWIGGLFITHASRLVPVDGEVVRVWARICAAADKAGKPPKAMDSLIAASALTRGLTLVTRNTADFDYPGITLVNPWD